MAIVTVRPNSTHISTPPIVPGTETAHGATSDNSDTSYLDFQHGNFQETILNLTDYTIPNNAEIKQVRVRVRYKTISLFGGGGVVYWVVRFITSTGYYGESQAQTSIASSPVETVGGWQTRAPSGNAWTQSELNALQVDIYPGYYSGNVQMPRIYEVYVDIETNTTPTTTISSPSGTVTTTTRPPVLFSYSDAEGDAMEGYRAKLFHSDTYNAGGFDPNTSTPLYDTGKIGAYSPPQGGVAPPFDLLNNNSYRWYVWVYQFGGPQGTTGYGVSLPASSTFSLSVTPPTLPVITPTLISGGGGYVSLSVNSGGGSPSTSTILVERSQDSGITWSVVRGTPAVPGSTIYDFELIPGKGVIYRGRATAANGVTSVYSTPTASLTPVDNEWRLKDPINSSRNIILSVIDDKVSQRSSEDKAFFSPMGRKRKVSVSDVIRGQESQFTLEFLTQADYDAFEVLRNSQRTLFLTRGWTNEAWYIQFEQVLEMTLHNYSPTYRTVTISWIEMDAP